MITLTTDFGAAGPYVAEMKGVILSIDPSASIVDVTHAVAPQAVEEGAWVLSEAAFRFPPGAIHIAVVDPGVGSERRLIYARMAERHFLAPDNGLLFFCAQQHAPELVIELTNRRYWLSDVSATFHGRDILAPVAAHLSLGVAPEKLGECIAAIAPPSWPDPRREDDTLIGRVIAIDAFGNLITNLPASMVIEFAAGRSLLIECEGRRLRGLARTYSTADEGEPIALFGSHQRLELAVVNGSAANRLAASRGTIIRVVAGPAT